MGGVAVFQNSMFSVYSCLFPYIPVNAHELLLIPKKIIFNAFCKPVV